MATRMCVLRRSPSAMETVIAPSFSSGWERTTNASRRRLKHRVGGLTEISDAGSTSQGYTGSGVANDDYLVLQMISWPLNGAQTISGTVKAIFKASESNTTLDARAQLRIRVLSNDGTTERGVLLEMDASALSNEYNLSTLQSRKYPLNWSGSGATLSSVSAQDGDRIVVEIGHRIHSTNVDTATLGWQTDDGAADLDESEVDTGSDNSWIEFSQDLNFKPEPAHLAREQAQSKTAGTSLSTGTSMAVKTGDLLVIAFASDDVAGTYTPSNSGTALTWTLAENVNNAGNCRAFLWYATAVADEAITFTVTHPSLTARAMAAGLFRDAGDFVQAGGGLTNEGSSGCTSINTTTRSEPTLWIGCHAWEAPDGDVFTATSGGNVVDNCIKNGDLGTTGGGAASNISVVLIAAVTVTTQTNKIMTCNNSSSSSRANAGAGGLWAFEAPASLYDPAIHGAGIYQPESLDLQMAE